MQFTSNQDINCLCSTLKTSRTVASPSISSTKVTNCLTPLKRSSHPTHVSPVAELNGLACVCCTTSSALEIPISHTTEDRQTPVGYVPPFVQLQSVIALHYRVWERDFFRKACRMQVTLDRTEQYSYVRYHRIVKTQSLVGITDKTILKRIVTNID